MGTSLITNICLLKQHNSPTKCHFRQMSWLNPDNEFILEKIWLPLLPFIHALKPSFLKIVCLSVCVLSPSNVIFFEASHCSSNHMTRSRRLIGQPSFPTIWLHEFSCQPCSARTSLSSRVTITIPSVS